jgi:hypothetical protein
MALAPGVRLSPLESDAQIGTGGVRDVYRAADADVEREGGGNEPRARNIVAMRCTPASVSVRMGYHRDSRTEQSSALLPATARNGAYDRDSAAPNGSLQIIEAAIGDAHAAYQSNQPLGDRAEAETREGA